MRYCPNPDCRDRAVTGRPGEFLDRVLVCTTCETTLVHSPPLELQRPSYWTRVRKAGNLGVGASLGAYVAYWNDSLIEGAAAAVVTIFIAGPVFADRLIPGDWKHRGGGGVADVEGDSGFDTDGGDGSD